MSAPPQTPQPPQQEQRAKAPRRSRREQTRLAVQLVLVALITLFAVLNVNKVEVDWIVGSGHAPLIIVIAISLLVGVVLARFAQSRSSKRR
jgi:uncharacterized integral membrane protein